jgi:hypothetical protein
MSQLGLVKLLAKLENLKHYRLHESSPSVISQRACLLAHRFCDGPETDSNNTENREVSPCCCLSTMEKKITEKGEGERRRKQGGSRDAVRIRGVGEGGGVWGAKSGSTDM